ncbi:glycosyltransferase family 48 protein [Babjeviella inositovora NRRL Y-12698]|uniref:1,3-beta-glucan synthase n=1 Tax=Babjeviella inositovora NRRL Y-12698 TaxID=984486 RepID=A0A1E3QXT0_9ASCO|nr:glycosyltransferase family 48 protein [Babjeviella inositovora NRRL Y-12698]ODQ82473.1 glycosyltransferase family 48 protein [Babjeviella inositovora NRRL Y-12698]
MPVSGFRTPYLTSGRWNDAGRLGDMYGITKLDKEVSADGPFADGGCDIFDDPYDPYPSWNLADEVPVTRSDIESVFLQLTHIFGFQMDNTRNMFDHFLRLLDSRSSRMSAHQALRSLHADYIGGLNANFKKWYFAAQLDVDDTIGYANAKETGAPKDVFGIRSAGFDEGFSMDKTEILWNKNMAGLLPADCVTQVALYLLCWGEANNVRFMPECLCFIFKCCNDYFYSLDLSQAEALPQCTPSFLDHAITPLYEFYRDQSYELVNGVYRNRPKDHKNVIGYDDMNQLFWYRKGLERLYLKDQKVQLMSLAPHERYSQLSNLNWKKAFYKTYSEKRSWFHALVNFNRIWIIHVSVFWYYTSLNAPTLYVSNYQQSLNTQPTVQAKLSAMSLAGAIASLINIFATFFEYSFVPRKWTGAQGLVKRVVLLVLVFLLNLLPSIYLLFLTPLRSETSHGLAISISQFVFSILTTIYFSITPLSDLFGGHRGSSSRKYLPNKTFTASFSKLNLKDKLASCGLWIAVFTAKFLESYVFLTLSFRDPIRELSIMQMRRCVGELFFGDALCRYQPVILLALMALTDLVLFFLDTYLWYIVWNTIFSVCRSFYIGVSIWTPWRNIFSRLPKRIFSKVIATSDRNVKAKVLVSQIWNSVIISMYREHLLSMEMVQRLIYHQTITPGVEGGVILKEPTFFVSQEDQSLQSSLFESIGEAQRRITFFAQSLSTPMPEALPTEQMPTFTVLIPHYSEKITLSLREIIKEEDQYSSVTLLEYLKQLHPVEWENFVSDTKLLAQESFQSPGTYEELGIKEKQDDLPFYSVGFKVATPEYVLRTRIWASLRSQTLYRTISGFMNHSRAIKLLFDVENPDIGDFGGSEQRKLEEASIMALRKFRLIVSMQRMSDFTTEEEESKEFLLRAYPELQLAFIEKEVSLETGETTYHSSLVDGSCEILGNGKRKLKYRIRLSGNPILGDGKSDNQNHAIIFCRGEYIQLVDANQDNYLEECLKIRSLLAEFEEMSIPDDLYDPENSSTSYTTPVAIIGTREYIFSENIGILGDVAAGKEQTFGTLFARTLAQIGGKLHYGHPDFLNSIFMNTRGGVSKAQKGLHLNEDIYAGMNVLLRGGRIKHCEYIQCGKGRDLGFGSILNFTTKIGAGMGEQMLSREYFYLGTQLPLDRFLSFYYAHPGFHLNNVFIILSVKLLLVVCVNLAVLTKDSVICEYDRNKPITDPHRPPGCYNLIPIVEWFERCILSIFIVFAISFVPLCVQEVMERGVWRALSRLGKHFASCSPLFEVFVCKIYATSLLNDLAVGGARYIATGRGFATVRVPFSVLYSRFSSESMHFGAIAFLMIVFCSLSMWKLSLLYLWITIIALLICPFLYNPNQFSWNEFFIDYKHFLVWLASGNTSIRKSSWISYVRSVRTQITGSKRKQLGKPGDNLASDFRKPSAVSLLVSDLGPHAITTSLVIIAYLFSNSQNEVRNADRANSIMRLAFVSVGPIIVNMSFLVVLFVVSCVLGPLVSVCYPHFPSTIAYIAHGISILNHVFFFELLWLFQRWNISRTILGLCASIMVQGFLFKATSALFLTREFTHDRSNRAWWSGKWVTANLGWNILTQPLREYLCKIIELSLFTSDFFLTHCVLFVQLPILFIPCIDRWHSLMLFWLKPGRQIRPRVFSSKQRRSRRTTVQIYSLIYLCALMAFIMVFAGPKVMTHFEVVDFELLLPDLLVPLMQPPELLSDKKGLHATHLNTFKARLRME